MLLRKKDTKQKNNVRFCNKLGLAASMDIALQETKSNWILERLESTLKQLTTAIKLGTGFCSASVKRQERSCSVNLLYTNLRYWLCTNFFCSSIRNPSTIACQQPKVPYRLQQKCSYTLHDPDCLFDRAKQHSNAQSTRCLPSLSHTLTWILILHTYTASQFWDSLFNLHMNPTHLALVPNIWNLFHGITAKGTPLPTSLKLYSSAFVLRLKMVRNKVNRSNTKQKGEMLPRKHFKDENFYSKLAQTGLFFLRYKSTNWTESSKFVEVKDYCCSIPYGKLYFTMIAM